MRAILVDDEPRAREVLRYYLERAGGVEVVAEAASGSEAVGLARQLAPDVVFLDIRLPDLSGMEVAELLAPLTPAPRVVFVTAHESHAVAAFEAEAFDYLVKPLTAARVIRTVERLRSELSKVKRPPEAETRAAEATGRVPVEIGAGRSRRTVLVDMDAILVVEAYGKGAVLRTAQAEYETPVGLSAWEEVLPAGLFLRIHRSFVVNCRAIREVFTEGRTRFIRMDGRPEALPVSRERLPELRRRLDLPE
jgi:DNA-binding LytR/AlgR family response regulator